MKKIWEKYISVNRSHTAQNLEKMCRVRAIRVVLGERDIQVDTWEMLLITELLEDKSIINIKPSWKCHLMGQKVTVLRHLFALKIMALSNWLTAGFFMKLIMSICHWKYRDNSVVAIVGAC